MTYSVSFTKSAFKQLKKVPLRYYENIKQAIISLADEPRPVGCKKLKTTEAYRIRVGTYRIIYEIIDDKLIVDIIAVGHRQGIYL